MKIGDHCIAYMAQQQKELDVFIEERVSLNLKRTDVQQKLRSVERELSLELLRLKSYDQTSEVIESTLSPPESYRKSEMRAISGIIELIEEKKKGLEFSMRSLDSQLLLTDHNIKVLQGRVDRAKESLERMLEGSRAPKKLKCREELEVKSPEEKVSSRSAERQLVPMTSLGMTSLLASSAASDTEIEGISPDRTVKISCYATPKDAKNDKNQYGTVVYTVNDDTGLVCGYKGKINVESVQEIHKIIEKGGKGCMKSEKNVKNNKNLGLDSELFHEDGRMRFPDKEFDDEVAVKIKKYTEAFKSIPGTLVQQVCYYLGNYVTFSSISGSPKTYVAFNVNTSFDTIRDYKDNHSFSFVPGSEKLVLKVHQGTFEGYWSNCNTPRNIVVWVVPSYVHKNAEFGSYKQSTSSCVRHTFKYIGPITTVTMTNRISSHISDLKKAVNVLKEQLRWVLSEVSDLTEGYGTIDLSKKKDREHMETLKDVETGVRNEIVAYSEMLAKAERIKTEMDVNCDKIHAEPRIQLSRIFEDEVVEVLVPKTPKEQIKPVAYGKCYHCDASAEEGKECCDKPACEACDTFGKWAKKTNQITERSLDRFPVPPNSSVNSVVLISPPRVKRLHDAVDLDEPKLKQNRMNNDDPSFRVADKAPARVWSEKEIEKVFDAWLQKKHNGKLPTFTDVSKAIDWCFEAHKDIFMCNIDEKRSMRDDWVFYEQMGRHLQSIRKQIYSGQEEDSWLLS